MSCSVTLQAKWFHEFHPSCGLLKPFCRAAPPRGASIDAASTRALALPIDLPFIRTSGAGWLPLLSVQLATQHLCSYRISLVLDGFSWEKQAMVAQPAALVLHGSSSSSTLTD